MSDEKDMVEDRKEDDVQAARNLPDAASGASSYAAINNVDGNSEIAKRAYELYQERGAEHGEHDGDWFRAEEELRRTRDASDA